MSPAVEFEVISVDPRKLGTYYRLNAAGKAASAGLVTVKHTLKDTWVCLTCVVAFVAGDDRHKGCVHTRTAQRYLAEYGEPEETIVAHAEGADTDTDTDTDIDEDYR